MLRGITTTEVGGVRVVRGKGGDLSLTLPGHCTLTCLVTFLVPPADICVVSSYREMRGQKNTANNPSSQFLTSAKEKSLE